MKYIIDTKNKSICYDKSWKNVDDHWKMSSYSDNTYASNPENKAVLQAILFFGGYLLAWKSRGRKTVTLSLT